MRTAAEPGTDYLQMPLGTMVDLVANYPEEGIVNFSLLQTILRVLVKQTNTQEFTVELHGKAANALQNVVRPPVPPSVNITEHKLSEIKRDSSQKKKKIKENILVVESTDEITGMAITKRQLDGIQTDLRILKEKVKELTDLPLNSNLIDAVKGDTNSNAVGGMYQMLTLSKRIDAAEIGMNKIASLVEDLIKSPLTDKSICKKKDKRESSTKSDTNLGGSSRQTENKPEDTDSDVKDSLSDAEEMVGESGTKSDAKKSNEGVVGVTGDVLADIMMMKTFFEGTEDLTDDEKLTLPQIISMTTEMAAKILRKKVPKHSDEDILASGEEKTRDESKKQQIETLADMPPDVQLIILEEKFQDYNEQLQKMDQNFNDEIAKLSNQFTDIEKDFNEILAKIEGGLPAGDSQDTNQCCAEVYKKIIKLQTEFEILTDTSSKLMEDKDDRQKKMDEMLEQIEMLKTIKADKEDIQEALADKADACAVHRKVSHDQFDSACDELSKGIEEALNKLSQQESLWQQALDDIQNEIGNKLDKMDLGPLREFINNKLKLLQEKMKSLAALKREQEAAGTKTKYLRNVNCISCDKDVVMRKEMDGTLRPQPYKAPPTRSLGPYLAYELDALRKQQKGIPGSRNLNNFEAAMAAKDLKKADDHICNRYCGGSHTVTTPHQRVTRLGHFLMQWGPEAIPQTENKIEEKPTTDMKTQSVIVQSSVICKKSEIRKSTTKLPQSKTKAAGASPRGSTESVSKQKSEKKSLDVIVRASVSATKKASTGTMPQNQPEETGDMPIIPEEPLSESRQASETKQPSIASAHIDAAPSEGEQPFTAPTEVEEEKGDAVAEAPPPAEEQPAETTEVPEDDASPPLVTEAEE